MKKLTLFLATVFLFTAGCQVVEEINTSCKVTKTVSNDGNTIYSYSTDGLLTNVEALAINMKIAIAYSEGKKISKMEFYSMVDSLLFYTDYTWTATNKIESESFFKTASGDWWQGEKTDYELNENGDPVKVSYYEKDMNNQWYVDHYKELIWSGGNLVRLEYFTLDESTGTFKNDRTALYEYDDKTNPWRGLSIKSVIVDDADILCTANNPLHITITNNLTATNSESITITYQYNNDNYPISYTKTHHYEEGTPDETETVSSIEYDCN